MGVERPPVHHGITRPAMPAGVSAAVSKAGDVTNEDLIRPERVPVRTTCWRPGDPLSGRGLYQRDSLDQLQADGFPRQRGPAALGPARGTTRSLRSQARQRSRELAPSPSGDCDRRGAVRRPCGVPGLPVVRCARSFHEPLVGGCDFEGRRQASARRIHALMPTGHRRGQALRTVPTRSFAEQCVESHTWPPALSYRTPPYDTKLQATRPREAGTGRQRRMPACLLTVIHTPPNPYTLDGWLPMRPGWWGDDGWRNPTDLPQLRRTRAAVEAAAGGQTERTAT